MSTSEFDKYEPDLFKPSQHEVNVFPADFSEADLAFAQDLDVLFTLDKEELPPLFVQTLMQAEEPRYQPTEAWFEKRIQARVFRRLKLKRRLFRAPHLARRTVVVSMTRLSRPWLIAVTMAFLFIIFTIFLTGTSFAAGLGYLWAGAHSGVLQVHHYPTLSTSSSGSTSQDEPSIPAELSMTEAQHLFHFPLSWPQHIPTAYTQSRIYFYPENSNWADGPIAVLDFYTDQPGQAPRHLYICEFKPQGIVLQVVQDGAAHNIQIDHETPSAIYIQGQWTPHRSSTPIWDYNVGNQLIIEKNAVVFWIVGDKSGGVNESDLATVGQSLTLLDQNQSFTYNGRMHTVTRSDENLPSFLANEVIYQINPDGSDGPSFRLVRALHPESHLGNANTGQ